MKSRNMIPESNGLYRVDMKEKVSKGKITKRIFLVILLIFLWGFLFQQGNNFIGREKISSSLHYAKVNGERLEYILSGAGEYTIVFDGEIGTNLNQWSEITKEIEEELGVSTFVYNRNGYGFSDIGSKKTPEEQAEALKILLRKSGSNSNKLILVGEGYGSLVMTNFAKLFPESVAGMLLIRPLDEEKLITEEYRDSIKNISIKNKIETIGTYFGLTYLLDYFNLTYEVKDFEKSLSGAAKEEYEIKSTKTNFRKAIENEYSNLRKYSVKSQVNGLMIDKPLYIISNNNKDRLSALGSKELTTVYKTKSKKDVISVTDKEAITDALTSIIRLRKKIDKDTI